jgi:hypothetical protein
MSRSYRKFVGKNFYRDKPWRMNTHREFRARERLALHCLELDPEREVVFPLRYEEVDDIWEAPSDGGTHFDYSGFNDFYRSSIQANQQLALFWSDEKFRETKQDIWKDWVKSWIGK